MRGECGGARSEIHFSVHHVVCLPLRKLHRCERGVARDEAQAASGASHRSRKPGATCAKTLRKPRSRAGRKFVRSGNVKRLLLRLISDPKPTTDTVPSGSRISAPNWDLCSKRTGVHVLSGRCWRRRVGTADTFRCSALPGACWLRSSVYRHRCRGTGAAAECRSHIVSSAVRAWDAPSSESLSSCPCVRAGCVAEAGWLGDAAADMVACLLQG